MTITTKMTTMFDTASCVFTMPLKVKVYHIVYIYTGRKYLFKVFFSLSFSLLSSSLKAYFGFATQHERYWLLQWLYHHCFYIYCIHLCSMCVIYTCINIMGARAHSPLTQIFICGSVYVYIFFCSLSANLVATSATSKYNIHIYMDAIVCAS